MSNPDFLLEQRKKKNQRCNILMKPKKLIPYLYLALLLRTTQSEFCYNVW